MIDLSAARIHRSLMARMIPLFVRTDADPNMEIVRLGSDYGGWSIPIALLDSRSTIYSVGIGEDASFDIELAERLKCTIQCIDPTPRANEYLLRLGHQSLISHPVGLWIDDTTLSLYQPKNREHVSLSVTDRFNTSESIQLPMLTLISLMEMCEHKSIDLLKMDIEGAEAEVLDQLVADGPFPKILAVEFERIESPRRTFRRIRSIREAGYIVVAVERNNITFVSRRVGGHNS